MIKLRIHGAVLAGLFFIGASSAVPVLVSREKVNLIARAFGQCDVFIYHEKMDNLPTADIEISFSALDLLVLEKKFGVQQSHEATVDTVSAGIQYVSQMVKAELENSKKSFSLKIKSFGYGDEYILFAFNNAGQLCITINDANYNLNPRVLNLIKAVIKQDTFVLRNLKKVTAFTVGLLAAGALKLTRVGSHARRTLFNALKPASRKTETDTQEKVSTRTDPIPQASVARSTSSTNPQTPAPSRVPSAPSGSAVQPSVVCASTSTSRATKPSDAPSCVAPAAPAPAPSYTPAPRGPVRMSEPQPTSVDRATLEQHALVNAVNYFITGAGKDMTSATGHKIIDLYGRAVQLLKEIFEKEVALIDSSDFAKFREIEEIQYQFLANYNNSHSTHSTYVFTFFKQIYTDFSHFGDKYSVARGKDDGRLNTAALQRVAQIVYPERLCNIRFVSVDAGRYALSSLAPAATENKYAFTFPSFAKWRPAVPVTYNKDYFRPYDDPQRTVSELSVYRICISYVQRLSSRGYSWGNGDNRYPLSDSHSSGKTHANLVYFPFIYHEFSKNLRYSEIPGYFETTTISKIKSTHLNVILLPASYLCGAYADLSNPDSTRILSILERGDLSNVLKEQGAKIIILNDLYSTVTDESWRAVVARLASRFGAENVFFIDSRVHEQSGTEGNRTRSNDIDDMIQWIGLAPVDIFGDIVPQADTDLAQLENQVKAAVAGLCASYTSKEAYGQSEKEILRNCFQNASSVSQLIAELSTENPSPKSWALFRMIEATTNALATADDDSIGLDRQDAAHVQTIRRYFEHLMKPFDRGFIRKCVFIDEDNSATGRNKAEVDRILEERGYPDLKFNPSDAPMGVGAGKTARWYGHRGCSSGSSAPTNPTCLADAYPVVNGQLSDPLAEKFLEHSIQQFNNSNRAIGFTMSFELLKTFGDLPTDEDLRGLLSTNEAEFLKILKQAQLESSFLSFPYFTTGHQSTSAIRAAVELICDNRTQKIEFMKGLLARAGKAVLADPVMNERAMRHGGVRGGAGGASRTILRSPASVSGVGTGSATSRRASVAADSAVAVDPLACTTEELRNIEPEIAALRVLVSAGDAVICDLAVKPSQLISFYNNLTLDLQSLAESKARFAGSRANPKIAAGHALNFMNRLETMEIMKNKFHAHVGEQSAIVACLARVSEAYCTTREACREFVDRDHDSASGAVHFKLKPEFA